MTLRFHWFLPTNGDGRSVVGGGHGVATGSVGAIRPASLGYLGQIARSAEQLGFEAALTPAKLPPVTGGGTVTMKTVRIGGVTVLTNANGLTLYWFGPDTPTTSKCTG